MKFGIIGNISKPALKQTLEELVFYLTKNKHEVFFNNDLFAWAKENLPTQIVDLASSCTDTELSGKSDFIVALGGDGTMLLAARLAGDSGKPILGINLGKLGFLAEVSIGELKQCLDEIENGDYFIEERMLLQAKNIDEPFTLFALNDIVIDKGNLPRVIELETIVNNDYLITYSADGIIFSTPTGSTAYSLAAGGPIVSPQSNVITINPLAPHSLTARPVIVPDSSNIRVIVRGVKSAHITADGQVEKFYDAPAVFVIQKASYTIRLVKRKNRTYFDLLRAKLQWGKDVRTSKS